MERECFENPAIAAILNDHFVNIKVDREERPDLDAIYMHAVQLLNQGQGGWPMSVFLTPEGQPFYAGTYFPPQDNYGRPGFSRLLKLLADAWTTRRDEVLKSAASITESLAQFGDIPEGGGPLSDRLLQEAAVALRRAFDPVHGGFGRAPKFPHALELRVLIAAHRRFADDRALQMVTLTLEKMARGGIYDQLGGGFHRYSVDAHWLVPHFEKMLYDNALLTISYLEAWQTTQEPLFRRVVEETLDYVIREMQATSGGFYATQDADSEGHEGRFFVWSLNKLRKIGGDEAVAEFGATPEGNWEGTNILTRPGKALPGSNDSRIAKLRQYREQRIKPGRDEKILTGWNGLMIVAFAEAGPALGHDDFTNAGVRAATFVRDHLMTPTGDLFRVANEASVAKLPGGLDDYAATVEAFAHLATATGDDSWASLARTIARRLIARFRDDADGGFFTTPHDGEKLIARLKDQHDGSTPSGNALAAMALIRVGRQTADPALTMAGQRALSRLTGVMEQTPSAAGQALLALDLLLGNAKHCGPDGVCTL